jgi:thiamine-monophosphate kinase
MTVSELGERRLLARIRGRLPRQAAGVVVGIGDDAAVVTGGRNVRTVLTVDSLVEGVHFLRTLSTAADIGHKALAVNLSDLAAMGAAPRWALSPSTTWTEWWTGSRVWRSSSGSRLSAGI